MYLENLPGDTQDYQQQLVSIFLHVLNYFKIQKTMNTENSLYLANCALTDHS